MCLQVRRYPDTPVTGVQLSVTLLCVVLSAAKLFTFGRSTKTARGNIPLDFTLRIHKRPFDMVAITKTSEIFLQENRTGVDGTHRCGQ